MVQPNFGQELRRLRGAADLSLRGLARQVHYDPGYVSKVENGAKKPTAELAAACDGALETGGVLAGLVSPARPPTARSPGRRRCRAPCARHARAARRDGRGRETRRDAGVGPRAARRPYVRRGAAGAADLIDVDRRAPGRSRCR
ncbi:MAG: helix-turn-helix domain-containing protein [Pseudonocardiaceae bacterium]|nr:helix-turn-helix domain-containing protein [Pseudonocardiaceae bacterium]